MDSPYQQHINNFSTPPLHSSITTHHHTSNRLNINSIKQTYTLSNKNITYLALYLIFNISLPSMIYHFNNNSILIDSLRRKWRKSKQYTVRVTNSGTVCVIRMPLHKDTKTEAQLKCRERFTKAQSLMLEAIKNKKRLHFFQKRRLRLNYKTLRGCILSYYIDQLISQEKHEMQNAIAQKMTSALSSVETYTCKHLSLDSSCSPDNETPYTKQTHSNTLSFNFSQRLNNADTTPHHDNSDDG